MKTIENGGVLRAVFDGVTVRQKAIALSCQLALFVALLALGGPAYGGLVAQWTFNEATGTTAFDHSGNENNATFTGGVTRLPVGGLTGTGAVSLDGVTGEIDVPRDNVPGPGNGSLELATAVTMIAWIDIGDNGTELDQRMNIVGFPPFEGYTLEYRHTGGGRVRALIRSSGGAGTASSGQSNPASGGFDFFAGVYPEPSTANRVGIYQNVGPLVTVIDNTPVTGSGIGTTGFNLQIGYGAFSGDHLAATIDEIRIYDTALTQAELQAIFTAGPSTAVVPEPGTGAMLLLASAIFGLIRRARV